MPVDARSIAVVRQERGILLERIGKPIGAREEYEAALKIYESLGPDAEQEWLFAAANFANVLRQQGEVARSLSLFREVIASLEKLRGSDHPDVLAALGNYATALDEVGQEGQSAATMKRVVDVLRQQLGPDHPDTLAARHNRAAQDLRLGRRKSALDELHEISEAYAEGSPEWVAANLSLVSGLASDGLTDRALERVREILRSSIGVLGEGHPLTLKAQAAIRAFGGDLTDLRSGALNFADLSGLSLVRGSLNGAVLRGAKLSGADLTEADLSQADLSGADLARADLSRCRLRGANLSGANLQGANLADSDLSDALLAHANLTDADLSRADVTGADLAKAQFVGAKFVGIQWNESTRWPEGRPLCEGFGTNSPRRQLRRGGLEGGVKPSAWTWFSACAITGRTAGSRRIS
jgi:uncharacterized protein YjbI with pentapeptide repeats